MEEVSLVLPQNTMQSLWLRRWDREVERRYTNSSSRHWREVEFLRAHVPQIRRNVFREHHVEMMMASDAL